MVWDALVWRIALKVINEHVEYLHLAPILGAVPQILYKKVRT